MRLMSVWVRPRIAPMIIEAIATDQMIGRQFHDVPLKAMYNTRSSAPNAATFVQEAMNADTGVGAPWFLATISRRLRNCSRRCSAASALRGVDGEYVRTCVATAPGT